MKVRDGERPIQVHVGSTKEEIFGVCRGLPAGARGKTNSSRTDGGQKNKNVWKKVQTANHRQQRCSAPPRSGETSTVRRTNPVSNLIEGHTEVQVVSSTPPLVAGLPNPHVVQEHPHGGGSGRKPLTAASDLFDVSASSSSESCDSTLVNTEAQAPPLDINVDTIPKSV